MKKIELKLPVFRVEYQFLIESGTYISLIEFEKDLADFFAASRIDIEFIETKGGVANERTFLLRPLELIETKIVKPKPVKQLSPKQQLDKLRK